MALFGSGSAGAINEYVGLTYEKAAEASPRRQPRHRQPVGEVTYPPPSASSPGRVRKLQRLGGNYRGGPGVYVDLNCNDTKTAGHPGYSAMTPIGCPVRTTKPPTCGTKASSIATNYAKATEVGVASGMRAVLRQLSADLQPVRDVLQRTSGLPRDVAARLSPDDRLSADDSAGCPARSGYDTVPRWGRIR